MLDIYFIYDCFTRFLQIASESGLLAPNGRHWVPQNLIVVDHPGGAVDG
jgi:hypothetical protein